MPLIRTALLLAGSLLLGAASAAAESAECQAELKQQDAQCQALAEKLAEACPNGANIRETPACREISSQIASTCTRRPCAPPRKGKRKGSGKGSGMSGSRKR